MKNTKIIFLLLSFVFFLLASSGSYISIGEFWRNLNVLSLIGFQQLIEYIIPINQFSIWNLIIVPVLKIKVLFLLSILSFIIFIILSIKR